MIFLCFPTEMLITKKKIYFNSGLSGFKSLTEMKEFVYILEYSKSSYLKLVYSCFGVQKMS